MQLSAGWISYLRCKSELLHGETSELTHWDTLAKREGAID